ADEVEVGDLPPDDLRIDAVRLGWAAEPAGGGGVPAGRDDESVRVMEKASARTFGGRGHLKGGPERLWTDPKDAPYFGGAARVGLPQLLHLLRGRELTLQRAGAGVQPAERRRTALLAVGEPHRRVHGQAVPRECAAPRAEGRGREEEARGLDVHQAEPAHRAVSAEAGRGGRSPLARGGGQAPVRDGVPEQRLAVAAVEGGRHREPGGDGPGRRPAAQDCVLMMTSFLIEGHQALAVILLSLSTKQLHQVTRHYQSSAFSLAKRTIQRR
ncbi:hypothetical protein THAOC_33235, partial [Thalassiosira oceanica]